MKRILHIINIILWCTFGAQAQQNGNAGEKGSEETRDRLATQPFIRGGGGNPSHQSIVMPLNFQEGVDLNPLGNDSIRYPEALPWFSKIQKVQRSYLTVVDGEADYLLRFENPVAAFGSAAGGTPIYANQDYSFLISVGKNLEAAPIPNSPQVAEILISAYSKNAFLDDQNHIAPAHQFAVQIPQRGTSEWTQFASNGQQIEISDPRTGLKVLVEENATDPEGNISYILTFRSSNTDYYFKVEAQGTCKIANTWYPMTNSIHESDPAPRDVLFCLNFDPPDLTGASEDDSLILRRQRRQNFVMDRSTSIAISNNMSNGFGRIKSVFGSGGTLGFLNPANWFGGRKRERQRKERARRIWREKERQRHERIANELHNQLENFRARARAAEVSTWYMDYDEAKIRENHEWHHYLQGRGIDRTPRLQKIAALERRWKEKEAEVARELEAAIQHLHGQAIADSLLPWYEEYRVEALREDNKWRYFRQHHHLQRGPYLERLQQAKERLEREYHEQKGVAGVGETRSYMNMSGLPGLNKMVADPVNVVTGEFYIHVVDLTLNGPMPFEIGRNYSSQNVADSTDFGHGWKSSHFPYLLMSRDKSVIHITETDGSVIAYIQQPHNPNQWVPTVRANAHLNNIKGETIGSIGNPFHAFVEKTQRDSDIIYTLHSPSGEKRTFKTHQFTKNGITNEKIFLEKWEDNKGNHYTFHFSTNPTDAHYGCLLKIVSSNGQSAQFTYDEAGRITQLSSREGSRNISYKYHQQGDLIEVSPTSDTKIEYEYQAHRLTCERKPNGRILRNAYDERGRVIEQSATLGDDPEPKLNASFKYQDRSPEGTKTISGSTEIKDVYGKITTYEYDRSLITQIRDPLNNKIHQEWTFPGDPSTNSYPRSLKKRTDQRGLQITFKYDPKGNLIEKASAGNLTGERAGETGVTRFSYNNNNLPLSIRDPLGNELVLSYENANYPWLPTRIDQKIQDKIVTSTQYTYHDVSEGGTFAKGLLQKVKRATGTPDQSVVEYTHNSRGFLTSKKQMMGAEEPDLLTRFSYNPYGQLVEEIAPSGAVTRYAYDFADNRSWTERRNEKGALLSSTYIYYNKNGEPEWKDNWQDHPEDSIQYRYDYAGRLKEERRFNKGSVENTHRGGELITYQHDLFGNLTEIHKNGHSIKMTYNDLGQMVTQKQGNKEQQAFTYEPGGEISSHTNALGGETKHFYTAEGKLYKQENPDGSIQQWRYQLDGRLAKEILSNSSYWETAYNDLKRTITRTLKDPSGQPLITENYTFDRRGNLISSTDGESHTFLKEYDKLDRIKAEIGPPSTPQAEQRTTSITYDDRKRTITSTNTLGEKRILSRDAIDRALSAVIQDASGQKVRENTYAYSPNKVVENIGLISTTTSLDGNSIFKIYADGSKQQIRHAPADNSISFINELGENTVCHYDHYDRLIKTVFPGKEIHRIFDASQKLYRLNMPRNLSWNVKYSQAGQKVSEELAGKTPADNNEKNLGSLIKRQVSRTYYTSGPNIGQLQKIRDARGLEHHITYDAIGRVKKIATSGSVNGVRELSYDRRGLLTSISQTSDQGEPIYITRVYSPYRDLVEENINMNGQPHQKTTQKWDQAGRRTEITTGNFRQEFSYRADAQLAQTRIPGQNKTIDYTYGLDGLLRGKTQGNLNETITLDSRGRIQSRTTQINNQPFLTETLGWRANSTLANYQAQYPGNLQQNRDLAYDNQGQLISETYPKKANENGTIVYEYETSGLGVRVKGYQYTIDDAALDPWSRPTKIVTLDGELKTHFYGHAFPNAKVQVKLNGVRYSTTSSYSRRQPSQELWTVPIAFLRPGEYVLKAEAYHPETLQTVRASALSTFSVDTQRRHIQCEYDAEGNLIKKTIDNTPRGSTTPLGYGNDPIGGRLNILRHLNHNQITKYTWDAWGRLAKVVQQDQDKYKKGYQWSAVYDSFGRRLKTVYTPMIADAPVTAETQTILSYYDPDVEFLEIGVKLNDAPVTWKAYGPDKDGTYGGLQGIGGLEAIITPTKTYSVINDALGHTVAMHDGTDTKTNLVTSGAFGPLPGNQNLYLSSERDLAEVTNWLGKRMDPTGLYYMGMRDYDYTTGCFISPDPYGHFGSWDLHSYANNDGINFCDPDGRLGKQAVKVIDANLATPQIGVSMAYGGMGTAANMLGLKSVGNALNVQSVKVLQNVADRWTAANEGPMGRIFDKQIHATTSLIRPLIGHTQQQFLADWWTGNLQEKIEYDPNSPQVWDMMTASNTNRERTAFYAAGGQTREIINYDTGRAYWDTIVNPFTANWKSTAMQVGGYGGATIANNNDGTATYKIRNVAGANSFFFHMVPNLPNKTGPMHNVEQVFKWKERVDQNRLPRN